MIETILFITGIVGSNSRYGACIKCTVDGEWDKRGHHMSYSNTQNCVARTDQDFRNKVDDHHHKEDSPLTKLPINMIEDVIVADSLHLFDLGNICNILLAKNKIQINFQVLCEDASKDGPTEALIFVQSFRPIKSDRYPIEWKVLIQQSQVILTVRSEGYNA